MDWQLRTIFNEVQLTRPAKKQVGIINPIKQIKMTLSTRIKIKRQDIQKYVKLILI